MAYARPLVPDHYYHLYSRGINGEPIFRVRKHYTRFLELYKEKFHPVVDTYAYCLMGNHFHFLVRVKEENEVKKVSLSDPRGRSDPTGRAAVDEAHKLFGRVLMAYAKKFNAEFGRTGGLFERPFGRKPITDDSYFTTLITYIHNNPVEAGFVNAPPSWHWSSYNAILSQTDTLIQRETVLQWFDGRDEFLKHHQA